MVRDLPPGVPTDDRADARAHLAVAFGTALLVSGLALVVGVLPAEFGVDPTGLGGRLGLLAINDVTRQVAAFEAGRDAEGAPSAVVTQTRPFQQETVTFTLQPGEFVEYKYRLNKGEALLYAWRATSPVNLEFHAEPDGAPAGYAETYDKRNRVDGASGTLVAPFTGIHGWFWENASDGPVTVTLQGAGFFTMSHEFHKDAPTRTRMFP